MGVDTSAVLLYGIFVNKEQDLYENLTVEGCSHNHNREDNDFCPECGGPSFCEEKEIKGGGDHWRGWGLDYERLHGQDGKDLIIGKRVAEANEGRGHPSAEPISFLDEDEKDRVKGIIDEKGLSEFDCEYYLINYISW